MNNPFRRLFSFIRGGKESSSADKLTNDNDVTVEAPQPPQEEAKSTFANDVPVEAPQPRQSEPLSTVSDKPVTEHKFYTKEELVTALKAIKERGWVENTEPQNDGAVGDVLEHLLGIPRNNIPMPDATEWELKAQRIDTASLVSLSHNEPEPRAERIVPKILLPLYGWEHDDAGKKYPADEKSFRQTMNGRTFTDRGFKVVVNRNLRRIEVVFDSSQVDSRHKAWLGDVEQKVGLGSLPVTPYWSFNNLFTSIGRKFYNVLYVRADVMRKDGKQYFHYVEAYFLKKIDIDKFVDCIENGIVRIEFNARTGHNHGTRFRMFFKDAPLMYQDVQRVM